MFLYQTIPEHREQGMTFNAIAEWLNKEGYLTVRGEKFRGARSFYFKKESGRRRVIEMRESSGLVRLQCGGSGLDYFDE